MKALLILIVFAGPFELQDIKVLDLIHSEKDCWEKAEEIRNTPGWTQYSERYEVGCIPLENISFAKNAVKKIQS